MVSMVSSNTPLQSRLEALSINEGTGSPCSEIQFELNWYEVINIELKYLQSCAGCARLFLHDN